MLHLIVGQSSVAARTPVDDIIAFIDEPFLVQSDKDLANGLRQAFIHGEALALPVARRTQFFQLVDDSSAFFLPPGPNTFNKGIAAQVVTGLAFAGKLPLDNILGGNTGMIGSRHPQGVVARTYGDSG